MDTQEICSLIIYIVVVSLTLYNTYHTSKNKNKNAPIDTKQNDQQGSDKESCTIDKGIFDKIVETLSNTLPLAMIDAEKQSLKGFGKKTYVMSCIAMEFVKKGLAFNDFAQLIDDSIENYVAMANELNNKSKCEQQTDYYGVK